MQKVGHKRKTFLEPCKHLVDMGGVRPIAAEPLPQSRTARLPGCTLHYLEWEGADQGPPILMLHGWPQDSHMWRRVATSLAGRRRLIAPDLRGFGQSATPGFGYTPRYFALDQIALLDHLGIPEIDLIGHDWGGWTSFLLGLRWPSRVRNILAISTPHPWVELRPQRLRGAWRILYTVPIATPAIGPALHRDGRYTRAILAAVDETDRQRQSEALRTAARARAMGSLYRYYFRAFARVASGYWRDRQLLPPLHLISGERDGLIPAALLDREALLKHAADATLELAPGAGHFLVDEQPDLIAERARNHFAI